MYYAYKHVLKRFILAKKHHFPDEKYEKRLKNQGMKNIHVAVLNQIGRN